MNSLAQSLITHQSIKTTLHKAKAARPLIERLISLAKENSLPARRASFAILKDHKLVSLLFNEIGPRFTKIEGGYTRILHLGQRHGDNAKTAILELTQIQKKEKTPKKEKEIKASHEPVSSTIHEAPAIEKKPETAAAVKEKPPIAKKPAKKFLGGLRSIFKKERDSL